MSDKKISQLTAAATPLAGTETLPIVQSGSTVKVAVNNLFENSSSTKTGLLSSTDWTTFNNKVSSQWTTSGSYIYYNTGNVGIGTATPTVASGLGLVLNGGAGQTRLAFKNSTTGDAAGDGVQFALVSTGFIYQNRETGGYHSFEIDGVEYLQVASTGNINVPAGNVVIGTSGKGIDFSATAGTGTSELLADYEEGDWTPTVTANSGSITSYTSSGVYTKVGRQVTCSFKVTITNQGTAVGPVLVTLPYTVGSYTPTFVGCGREDGTSGYALETFAYSGSTFAYVTLYQNGNVAVNNYVLLCSLTYFV